jgi:hypothetical protein
MADFEVSRSKTLSARGKEWHDWSLYKPNTHIHDWSLYKPNTHIHEWSLYKHNTPIHDYRELYMFIGNYSKVLNSRLSANYYW